MTSLVDVPARKIAGAISHAAERWRDADFPARVRAMQRVAARTGYSVPVVEYALDRLFFSIDRASLEAVIAGELGDVEVLDGFRSRAGRTDAWARPIGNVCVISSRTTIGVALPAALFALCAKNDVLVKDREDSLIASFFETLREELPEFEHAARAEPWNSQDEAAPALDSFGAVAAFGQTETLAAIRNALPPEARFMAFGSRASAGYVSRESLSTPEAAGIARGAARDIVLYETEGCLSLHVLFVESGGAVSVEAFSQMVHDEIDFANVEFPHGEQTAHERALSTFRKAAAETALAEPPPFLPRLAHTVSVNAPSDALEYLRRHGLLLEGFALAGERADLIAMAVAAGAARLTRFGELQNPPLAGEHGGRPRIAEFIRWVDKTF
ncbi:MAG TPA: acyl-CoA reductase [Candidatus Rubrimentiphilum sp.]|nr:acyl-CoA reductase [Candidatus Rubrimentiphilum sp.]